MADTTQNSFSELIENFITMQNNAFLILQKLSESMTDTHNDTVSFTLSDVNGEDTIDYTIPTYKYFRDELSRIDSTVKSMLALEDGNDASIRNADGTYSRIYKYSLMREPNPIGEIKSPVSFKTKPNWFFEDYLNPYLFVPIDVSSYVDEESAKVKVKRIILNVNTKEETEAFEKYKGKNNVNLDELVNYWTSRGFTYINDDNIYDLSIDSLAYSGEFKIVGKVEDANGSLLFELDTYRYTDNSSKQKYTKELSVGDQLMYKDSLYRVDSIEKNIEIPRVKLTAVRGYDNIGVEKTLEIYSPKKSEKIVEVGVGYNEREVLFFKSIDSKYNVISSTWSPGVAFYTNDLLIADKDGKEMSLSEYYDNYVDDYGFVFKGMLKDNAIPAFYGETPNAPTLVANNFKVVQINEHLYDSAELEEIKSKAAEKIELESEIEQLNDQIRTIKTRIYNNNYTKDSDRKNDEADLQDAFLRRSSVNASYATVVKALNTKKIDGVVSLSAPKYRIRGFFDMPTAKFNKVTGTQEVAQFEIRYMYKSVEDVPPTSQQFDFVDGQSSTKLGTFTNWIYEKGPVRSKTYDEELGVYKWETPEMSNSDIEKCNQIEIPITKGEKVILQVRSLSEAGWPENPVKSAWSNEVEINFPEEFNTNDESQTALDGITEETARVKLQEDIEASGINDHLKDSSFLNARYWAHSAENINSGFKTSDGVIMTLYEKLLEQDNLIKQLQSQIASAKPEMVVSVIDDDGKVIDVHHGDIVKLNTCYYDDELKKLSTSEQNGAIITKTYYLTISNKSGSTLELVSLYPGAFNESFEDGHYINESSEWERKKYNVVPIVYNLNNAETGETGLFHQVNWGSNQLLSQFMYMRYTDVSGMNKIYEDHAKSTPISFAEGDTETGIFGGFDINEDGDNIVITPKSNAKISDFCVSSDCPILYTDNSNQWFNSVNMGALKEQSASDREYLLNLAFSNPSQEGLAPVLSENAGELVPAFETNDQFTASGEKPQQSLSDYAMTKMGFYAHERYCIGKRTCGSYFFAYPNDIEDLRVVGNDYLATRNIVAGKESDNIKLPLVFQFRMQDYKQYYGGYDMLKGSTASSYDKNFSYVRRLGFDIYQKDSSVFSFDVIATARCTKSSLADNTKSTTSFSSRNKSYSKKLTASAIKSSTR